MHSSRLKARVRMTTVGIWLMNLPIVPGMNSSGIKASHVVATAPMTGMMTCLAPSMAASERPAGSAVTSS